jgi:alpha-mannosidase
MYVLPPPIPPPPPGPAFIPPAHPSSPVTLPLDIHAPAATFGTQFGTIDRPTHRNTRVDQAKFEVCAHGFADLSEANYGVTLACRDKYGYAVEGNAMRLSLVRAPTTPDPETDQGAHEVEFAVIPHVGRGAMAVDAMRFSNACYGECGGRDAGSGHVARCEGGGEDTGRG